MWPAAWNGGQAIDELVDSARVHALVAGQSAGCARTIGGMTQTMITHPHDARASDRHRPPLTLV